MDGPNLSSTAFLSNGQIPEALNLAVKFDFKLLKTTISKGCNTWVVWEGRHNKISPYFLESSAASEEQCWMAASITRMCLFRAHTISKKPRRCSPVVFTQAM